MSTRLTTNVLAARFTAPSTLMIAGKKLRFIVSTDADPGSLQSDHVKELGRWISVSLSEDKMKVEIRKRVAEDLEKI